MSTQNSLSQNWICENCEEPTNDLTEITIDMMGEDEIWVCPACYHEIREDQVDFIYWLHGVGEEQDNDDE